MIRRCFTIVALIGIVVFTITALCIGWVVYNQSHHIVTVSFGNGHAIRLWTEYRLQDWDPDIADPTIYYEITHQDTVTVPKTYLGLDFGYDYDIRYAFAESKTLVCVYDSRLWDKGVFIIYDVQSGESWPRLGAHEVSHDPTVKQKWRERYQQLRRENPGLPQHYLVSGE